VLGKRSKRQEPRRNAETSSRHAFVRSTFSLQPSAFSLHFTSTSTTNLLHSFPPFFPVCTEYVFCCTCTHMYYAYVFYVYVQVLHLSSHLHPIFIPSSSHLHPIFIPSSSHLHPIFIPSFHPTYPSSHLIPHLACISLHSFMALYGTHTYNIYVHTLHTYVHT
jgi:hypothetical protein